MSVGLLIITHNNVGEALLAAATTALAGNPVNSRCLSVDSQCVPKELEDKARQHVEGLDQGQGVLILTDMYGSTPSNIACALMEIGDTAVVSGVNLPMLLRVLNYPQLSLEELVEKAISGGCEGIMDCRSHRF